MNEITDIISDPRFGGKYDVDKVIVFQIGEDDWIAGVIKESAREGDRIRFRIEGENGQEYWGSGPAEDSDTGGYNKSLGE